MFFLHPCVFSIVLTGFMGGFSVFMSRSVVYLVVIIVVLLFCVVAGLVLESFVLGVIT